MDNIQKREQLVVSKDGFDSTQSTDQISTINNQEKTKPAEDFGDEHLVNDDNVEIALSDSVTGYKNFVAAQAEPGNLGQLKTFQVADRGTMSANDEDVSIFIRSDQKVQVAQHKGIDSSIYLSAQMSRVMWRQFEALVRAVLCLICAAFKIDISSIKLSHGLIIEGETFSPAARFSFPIEFVDQLKSTENVSRLSRLIAFLGDQELWSYAVDRATKEAIETIQLIEAARKARTEISGKELSAPCNLTSSKWVEEVTIPIELCPNTPPKKGRNTVSLLGTSCGFCKHDRHLHFVQQNSELKINISFDVELFLVKVVNVGGGMNQPVIQVDWEEYLEDDVVKTRTLKEITVISAQLLEN